MAGLSAFMRLLVVTFTQLFFEKILVSSPASSGLWQSYNTLYHDPQQIFVEIARKSTFQCLQVLWATCSHEVGLLPS